MTVMARQVIHVEIAQIERDADLQARVGLNTDVVKDYAEQMSAGAAFPPVLLFKRPGAYALVDGFHRVAARETLGLTTVLAEVRDGTREEAVWHGLTVNQRHGLRRSNEDKHRCVVKALTHPRGCKLSDRQLGSHCGVHHYTVSRIRQQLEKEQVIEVNDTRVVTRGGVSYSQRLQKPRGAASPAPAAEPQLHLAPRLDERVAQPDQRVRRLIHQAHERVKEALGELSRTPCDAGNKHRRLTLHLTHLLRELTAAEGRLLEATTPDACMSAELVS